MTSAEHINSLHSGSKAQEILLKITQGIISTLDYQEVLQIISDGMSELLDIETAAIYLVDKDNHLFLGATTPALPPDMPEHLRYLLLHEHPHIQKTIFSRQPQVLIDTQNERLSIAEKKVVDLRKLRSVAYFPFIEGIHVLGVLILGTSNKQRLFTSDEVALGQMIANQLSIGIQNAKLHTELAAKNLELEVEISERKKTEIALRDSEAHLSNALRIARLGHWEYDFNKDCFLFTDEFYALFRTSFSETGTYCMSVEEYSERFLFPEDRDLVQKEVEKGLANTIPDYSAEVEHKIKYADGEMGYIIVRYRVLRDGNGEIVKLFGVNQDITSRKKFENELLKAKEKLQESENLYRSLFDQAAEGIFLMNEEGEIIQSNQAFAEMHGYTSDEILQMNIIDLDVLGAETFTSRPEIAERLMRGESVRIEAVHYHKQGHTFPLLVAIQQLRLNQATYFLCFHQDLTEQKRVEEELRMHKDHLEGLVKEKTKELDNLVEELQSANDELSQKNEIINEQNKELKHSIRDLKIAQTQLVQSEKMASLGILTAGVAHEINNPLNYIMGSYLALEKHYKEESGNTELVRRMLDRLKTGLDNATQIVQSLNQFSRDNKVHNEDCDIHSTLDNCLVMLGEQLRHKIEIEKVYSNKKIIIKGNTGQLHQAFLNILNNAIQAIHHREGKIKIITRIMHNQLIIQFEDNGEGISEENLSRIFDPFFTTKDPGKGTGLGLAITYSIIQEHKGNIELKSERESGTLVRITFPIQ